MRAGKCPQNWRPTCRCAWTADALDPDCYYHGGPDVEMCPWCRKRRGLAPCENCGCDFGVQGFERDGYEGWTPGNWQKLDDDMQPV